MAEPSTNWQDHPSQIDLREYVDMLNHQRIKDLEELQQRITERSVLVEVAVAKAERSVDERLKTLNEIRGAMGDLQSTFLTIKAYEARHDALLGEMSRMRDTLVEIQRNYVTVAANDSNLNAMRSERDRLREDLKLLQLSAATLAGKASQSGMLIGYAFTALSIVLAVAGLVERLLGH